MNVIESYKKQMFKPMDNLAMFNLLIDHIKKYLRLREINKVRTILSHLQPENMISNLKRFDLTERQLNFVLSITDIIMFVDNKATHEISDKDIEKLVRILDNIEMPLK